MDVDGSGILLRGPPGAGKSDLALRLIEAGATLVADDQVYLWSTGNGVLARSPASIDGLLEVRGLGIIRMQSTSPCPVRLIVDLASALSMGKPPQHEGIERMPDPVTEVIEGVCLPRVVLAPFEASTPAQNTPGTCRRPQSGASDLMSDDLALAPSPSPSQTASTPSTLVMITGMSGAGRSTALKVLEDLGYESIDQSPPCFCWMH